MGPFFRLIENRLELGLLVGAAMWLSLLVAQLDDGDLLGCRGGFAMRRGADSPLGLELAGGLWLGLTERLIAPLAGRLFDSTGYASFGTAFSFQLFLYHLVHKIQKVLLERGKSPIKDEVDLALDEHVDFREDQVHPLFDAARNFVVDPLVNILKVVLYCRDVFLGLKWTETARQTAAVLLHLRW